MSDGATSSVLTSGWEMDRRPVDVVVISSQVVYGSVGATASARVLAEAGHRSVQVPTVLLGTLPHYPMLHGGPIADAWLGGILDDLLTLGAIDRVRYVLVGYLAHAGQARIIAEWFDRLRTRAPRARLIVDPAMGDDDVGLYTDPAVAASYAEHLVPLAHGLTPNRFELEMLSGARLRTPDDLRAAAESVRTDAGWVVVTSAGGADEGTVTNLLVADDDVQTLSNPRVPTRAKGAGDVYAATIVARLVAGDELATAVAGAGSAVADALREAESPDR